MCSGKKHSWVIPFGGNAFITEGSSEDVPEVITPCGLSNWISTSTNVSLFFHIQYPGKLLAALRLRIPNGTSRISFSLSHYENSKKRKEDRDIDITGSPQFQLVDCGIFAIPSAGYVKLDLKGLERSGSSFAATVSHVLLISETYSLLEPNYLRFVDDPENFYFGRRGPSVHFRYDLPEASDTEYFYNEIYVPENNDIIGAYYCAMGFTGGYFGIQVNSEHERRVLFSIWSDYNTDNPDEIPEEYKVRLIRKGEDVYHGEFGNEGSGAQSYWRYMWQPGITYGFIVQTRPIDSERTMYTAWFNTSESPNTWKLIASFDKPKVSIYFRSPYSFSENFIPEQGHIERQCIFSNQWALDKDGTTWTESLHGTFTADSTSSNERRMDIAGGVGIDGDRRRFFLRNCGFFSDRVEPRSDFTRESSGTGPPLDVAILP